MLYITGDIHGNPIDRFSYTKHPELRELTEEDFVIIAGDFGCVWDWKGSSKDDFYKLSWLNDKPWKTVVVLGNHEAWNLYEDMPYVTPDFLNCGTMKQCEYMGKTFENIYIVDSIATLDICDNRILMIAGADSTDKQWRIEGQTWWPQEKINIEKCLDFFEENDCENDFFDLIVTHDAPSIFNEMFDPLVRMESNEGERFFEHVRKILNFDCWIHGHMHMNRQYPEEFDSRIMAIYEVILRMV